MHFRHGQKGVFLLQVHWEVSLKMSTSKTNKSFLYAVKMRASKGDVHLSGAERLVGREQILPVSQSLLQRALNHANGNADAVHLKIEALDAAAVLKVPSLSVTEASATKTDEAFAVCFVRDKPSTAEFFRLFLSRNFVFSSKRFYALPSEQVARLGIPRHK